MRFAAFWQDRCSEKKDVGIVTTLHGTDITVLGHDMSLFISAIKFGIDGIGYHYVCQQQSDRGDVRVN